MSVIFESSFTFTKSMMDLNSSFFLTLTIFLLGASITQCAEKRIVCYYSSWAVYRPQPMAMNIKDIDTSMCTHLIYAFAGINLILDEVQTLDYERDITRRGYADFVALKEKNPKLKTYLAVGGWNEGSIKYSVMTYTEERREKFAENALRFLVNYGFDGLDFDWEYPADRGGIDEDKQNFVLLLQTLREKFAPWNLELSVAVTETIDKSNKAYSYSEICNVVDFVSIMAYDYVSSYSDVTGLLAPLTGFDESVEKTIQLWKDCDPSKLNLGIPAYGRGFILKDGKNNGIGAATDGPTPPGSFTSETGYLSNYELAETFLLTGDFKESCSEFTNCYSFNKTTWITYDNEKSAAEKTDWAMKKGLGGVMLWSLDVDDFKGVFSEEKYPMLRSISKAVQKESSMNLFPMS